MISEKEKHVKVLLMGGSVFVGRAIRDGLKEDGHAVTAVTRGSTSSDWEGVEHLACDRDDRVALRDALSGRTFDAVVDASCYTGAQCEGLLAALDPPPGTHLLISSAAVYDRSEARFPFREDAAVGGDAIWDDYGVEKYEAEQAFEAVGAESSRAFVIRPPYIFGPGNNLPREQALWARLRSDEPVLVPGAGETLVQMCHVDDIVEIVAAALAGRFEPGTYNVGPPRFHSFDQYLTILAEAAGVEANLHHVVDPTVRAREYFPFRENHLVLDTGLIHGRLDHRFRTLEETAAQTLEWFDARGQVTLERSAVESALLTGLAP